MEKLRYQIKNQRVIDLNTVLEIRTLVNQGVIGISGYEVTKNNGMKIADILPCIQQVNSEIEIIKYINRISESHEASTKDIVLMADALPNNDQSVDDVIKDTILIALSEGKHVLHVRYLPEHQAGLVDILTQIKKSDLEGYLNNFIDEHFRVSFEGVDSEEFFMPHYSITVDPNTSGLSLEELKSKVESHFEVIETNFENGKIVLECYAGEGHFVCAIRDILWVIMELFGPTIIESFKTIGINDYLVEFHVSEYS
ncbi:hypothetical protein [Brevibacillus panacihumi]|uniref:hypothetical protein n=1 Tax=Brevibacillus panacihumi TaxID=497735 RepID=UPI003D253C08